MKAILLASFLAAAPVCVAGEAGAQLAREACGACHSEQSRPLRDLRLTRQQWQESIERMERYGARVPDDKMQELLDYLAWAYGTVRPAANSQPSDPPKEK